MEPFPILLNLLQKHKIWKFGFFIMLWIKINLSKWVPELISKFYILFFVPPIFEMGENTCQQTVDHAFWRIGWWSVVSQTPPTLFKSSKWNMLHTMMGICACHHFCEPRSKGSSVMPLFSKFLYIYVFSAIFCVTKWWIGGILTTVSDSS